MLGLFVGLVVHFLVFSLLWVAFRSFLSSAVQFFSILGLRRAIRGVCGTRSGPESKKVRNFQKILGNLRNSFEILWNSFEVLLNFTKFLGILANFLRNSLKIFQFHQNQHAVASPSPHLQCSLQGGGPGAPNLKIQLSPLRGVGLGEGGGSPLPRVNVILPPPGLSASPLLVSPRDSA